MPVLCTGDIFSATLATIGINPSYREYLDTEGTELAGGERRFETLSSLEASDRDSLSQEQCDRAIDTMRGYFDAGRTVYYQWFNSLRRVTEAMGLRYEKREVAHLDLVQEATKPTWSELNKASPKEAESLLASDLPFLKWQLETFHLTAIFCNGKTAYEAVRRLVGAKTCLTGSIGRVTWYAGIAQLGRGTMGLAGWNIPLTRPAGLSAQGHVLLGESLANALSTLGVCLPRQGSETMMDGELA